jgi:glutamate-ammonia-ligase adenylyltransferase
MRKDELVALARFIDPIRARTLENRFSGWDDDESAALAAVVVTAYPAFGPLADAQPSFFANLCRDGWRAPRTRGGLLSLAQGRANDLGDGDGVRAALRRLVQYEKLRIAVRELLPPSLDGADVDVTSAEITALAEAAIEVALAEAQHYGARRFGAAMTSAGAPSTFVVLGMGKLGGRELNAGSDIDLLYLYDTDEGSTVPVAGTVPLRGRSFGPSAEAEALTLHEYWSHVARRLTATLDLATPEGTVWRVDLRLRPEGSLGAIANSLPAAERYYETFGRLWERAALVRARPVAGDLALGQAAIAELLPFVYARHVDPHLAAEIIHLVDRARAELSEDPERDLKLCRGGIREAEFFVQSLQLIWGGKEPGVQVTGMLDALQRLRARGLVTDREEREIEGAYLLLRRLEHRVQWASGLQTHALPRGAEEMTRLARSLGYETAENLQADIDAARASVRSRLSSLLPGGVQPKSLAGRFDDVIRWLDEADAEALDQAIQRAFGSAYTAELSKDIRQLARRPDDLLGSMSRERFPTLCRVFFDSLIDAADPEQAVRFTRSWLGRLGSPGVYVRPLGEDVRALRRLVTAFGASAFIGNAIANRPELGESVVFARRVPNPALARLEVDEEVAEIDLHAASSEDPDAFVGALRRAKARITVEVALADMAGDLGTRQATQTLSALGDAALEHATRFAMGTIGKVKGLAVIAVGKFGGNELGYGSDLDVLFVFDPDAAPPGVPPYEHFARRARRVIALLSTAHPEGPGHELDTRLRPSGAHGLLVTSLEAFARYHEIEQPGRPRSDEVPSAQQSGAAWERQALVRARFAAGDPELGEAVMRIADIAAYERGAPEKAELHRLRLRMERELGHERPGRYDLKVGRGGLADIEFAVQYLQMVHGREERVRTTETRVAIARLAELGILRADLAETFREGYRFLRQLEQRIRIVHGSSSSLLDENAEGLLPLARRMGMRDTPRATATEELVAKYRDVTSAVRAAYLEVISS